MAEGNKVMFCPSCGEMQTEGNAKQALGEGSIGFELCPHCRKDGEANVLDGRLMKFWHALSVLAGGEDDPATQAALLQVAAMLRMMQYLNAVGQVIASFATAFLEGISPPEEEEQPEAEEEAQEEPEAEGDAQEKPEAKA